MRLISFLLNKLLRINKTIGCVYCEKCFFFCSGEGMKNTKEFERWGVERRPGPHCWPYTHSHITSDSCHLINGKHI